MLLLFTSASDERPLYRRDLLNVCCEAKGTFIRFSYEKQWFAEDVWSKIASLKGNKALIIYCEKNSKYGRHYTYHPIRLTKVVDTYPENESVTIELELGDFFAFDNFKGDTAGIIDSFQGYVVRSEDQPTPTDRNKVRRYVREDTEWASAAYSQAWLPLIRHVRELSGLCNCYFFSIQQSNGFGESPSFMIPRYSFEHSRTVYKLKSGRSYEVSLYVVQGKEAVYKIPKLSIAEAIPSLSASGPFVRQRPLGFQADFVLHGKRAFEKERGLLVITMPADVPKDVRSSEIQALIEFGVSPFLIPLTILFLVFGPVLISLSPDLIRETALNLGAHPGNEFVKHQLVYSWVFKVLGAISFALGAFLGTRKLPFKS
jgi:hypothetical protein